MWAIWLLLASVIVLAVLTVWAVGRFPQCARECAATVARWLHRYDEVFAPDNRVVPAEVVFGSILLAVLLYAILGVYLPLFADTISDVYKFSPQRAFGIAVLVVLSTGFTGVLMHLLSRNKERDPFFWSVVLFAAFWLVYFQANLFRSIMPSSSTAWPAFGLIPMVEALGVYFATKFLWSFLGLMLYLVLRLPLLLLRVLLISREEPSHGGKSYLAPKELTNE